jgi:AraC family transcriptional regulator
MALGRAKLAVGQGLSVWVLEAPDGFGDARVHAHHAIQITLCLQGSLALMSGGETLAGPGIAVAADARHRFEARGLLAFVFVEPESRAGRALSEALFAEGRGLAALDEGALGEAMGALGATFTAGLGPEALLAAGWAAAERLAPAVGGGQGLPDARVQRVIDYAGAHLDAPLSLAGAAQDVGVHLSPSRLRHLFVEQTGLAFKTYLLWLRLMRALADYAGGRSLTEAAHAAGFADSAHFSRVFKRTFGLPATTLTRL